MQILACLIFLVLLSKNPEFIERGKSSEKVVTVEEELDGIDIDDIGSLRIHLDLCLLMRNLRISL